MKRLKIPFLQRWRREDGAASIEFVILFPLFISVFGSAFEAGLLTMRQVMLIRGTDIAVRELRLSGASNLLELKRSICNAAGVIPDCLDTLAIELVPVDLTTWVMPSGQMACVDRDDDINPVTQFEQGTANELMMVRVCAAVRPILPTTGLGLALPRINEKDYGLFAMSAFVNEP